MKLSFRIRCFIVLSILTALVAIIYIPRQLRSVSNLEYEDDYDCCSPNATHDCWYYLNVERTASDRQIRAAYRKEVLRLHPDKNGDPNRFQQALHAFTLISTRSARRKCAANRALIVRWKTVKNYMTIVYQMLDPRFYLTHEQRAWRKLYSEAYEPRDPGLDEESEDRTWLEYRELSLPRKKCRRRRFKVYVPITNVVNLHSHWLRFRVRLSIAGFCPYCNGSGDHVRPYNHALYNQDRANYLLLPHGPDTIQHICPICLGFGCDINANPPPKSRPFFTSSSSLSSEQSRHKIVMDDACEPYTSAIRQCACTDLRRTLPCPLCSGRGTIPMFRCSTCWGAGRVSQDVKLDIAVHFTNTTDLKTSSDTIICQELTCIAARKNDKREKSRNDPINIKALETTTTNYCLPPKEETNLKSLYSLVFPRRGDLGRHCDAADIEVEILLFDPLIPTNSILISEVGQETPISPITKKNKIKVDKNDTIELREQVELAKDKIVRKSEAYQLFWKRYRAVLDRYSNWQRYLVFDYITFLPEIPGSPLPFLSFRGKVPGIVVLDDRTTKPAYKNNIPLATTFNPTYAYTFWNIFLFPPYWVPPEICHILYNIYVNWKRYAKAWQVFYHDSSLGKMIALVLDGFSVLTFAIYSLFGLCNRLFQFHITTVFRDACTCRSLPTNPSLSCYLDAFAHYSEQTATNFNYNLAALYQSSVVVFIIGPAFFTLTLTSWICYVHRARVIGLVSTILPLIWPWLFDGAL